MLGKTITYTDYNGLKRTETFYFNLNKSELIEMDAMIPGGMNAAYRMILEKNDAPSLMSTFKTIILKAYGIKSADGRRFEKSEEISKAFEQSPAYDEFFMDLISGDGKNTLDFIRGILPADMQSEASEIEKELADTTSKSLNPSTT